MDKKEVKKLSKNFRGISSRLLNTKYGNEQQDLLRFLRLIEDTRLLKVYIESCHSKDYDFKEIMNNKRWNEKFTLPISTEEEINFIYQLLNYISETKTYWQVSQGYRTTSRRIQDHLDAFNDEVTKHLINHLVNYLEEKIEYSQQTYNESNLSNQPRIFLSYSWKNGNYADLIDDVFSDLGYKLTRDVRDMKFKQSIKEFMNTIGENDFVISIISYQYLTSLNCMYEIYEVMRDRNYKDKMLLVILEDSDINILKEKGIDTTDEPNKVAANIYNIRERIQYIKYWEEEEEKLNNELPKIAPINQVETAAEIRRVHRVGSNISEFINSISDWNNTTLLRLIENGFSEFITAINEVKR